MLRAMTNLLKALSITAIILTASYCLIYGVYILESGAKDYARAYTSMLIAASALIVLPASFNLSILTAYRRPLAVGLFLIALALLVHISMKIHAGGTAWTLPLVPYWIAAVVLMIVAGVIFDSKTRNVSLQPIFERNDWFFAFGIFLISSAVRMLSPMSMAVDEGIHFSEMLYFQRDLSVSPWSVTGTGYPWILHRILYFITSLLSPIVNTYYTTKVLVACLGGLSVSVLFLTVKLFAPRFTALTASTLLILLGWHWLNSRFGYLYPYDLACVSVSIMSALIALQYQRIGAAIVAGVMIGWALLLQKFGVFLIPFVGLLCLEYFITAERGQKKRIVGLGVLLFACVVLCYLPFLVANGGLLESPRYNIAKSTRAELLKQFGMTELQAFFAMWKDAFWQLQIEMHDIPRHVFRVNKPLLDPIFSGLFFVGTLAAIWHFFRRRECRIQIVGLLIFIAPMVVAFPLDSMSPHGMARRLLGVSFFCAWLAASGAVVICSRFVAARHVGKLCLGLALSSLLCNWYYLKTGYEKMHPHTWVADYGGKRAALINLGQSLSRHGMPVIILDEFLSSVQGVKDARLPFITVDSASALKQAISNSTTWNIVVIPWLNLVDPSSQTIRELSEIIPPHAWLTSDSGADGMPLYLYTFVWPRGYK
jgi:hypothetical protein